MTSLKNRINQAAQSVLDGKNLVRNAFRSSGVEDIPENPTFQDLANGVPRVKKDYFINNSYFSDSTKGISAKTFNYQISDWKMKVTDNPYVYDKTDFHQVGDKMYVMCNDVDGNNPNRGTTVTKCDIWFQIYDYNTKTWSDTEKVNALPMVTATGNASFRCHNNHYIEANKCLLVYNSMVYFANEGYRKFVIWDLTTNTLTKLPGEIPNYPSEGGYNYINSLYNFCFNTSNGTDFYVAYHGANGKTNFRYTCYYDFKTGTFANITVGPTTDYRVWMNYDRTCFIDNKVYTVVKASSSLYGSDGNVYLYDKDLNTYSLYSKTSFVARGATTDGMNSYMQMDINNPIIICNITNSGNMVQYCIYNAKDNDFQTFLSSGVIPVESFVFYYFRGGRFIGPMNNESKYIELISGFSNFVMKKGMKYNINSDSYIGEELVPANQLKEVTVDDVLFVSLNKNFSGTLEF